MESLKFNLDSGEHDRISRILKALFGVVCIGVAITTGIMMTGSDKMTTNNLIAIAFLGLFGIWLLLSGLGLTERYLTLSGNKIVIRDRAYSPARSIIASDLRMVEFSQLKITFLLKSEELVALRLGTYYRENSLKIMETLENFCASNSILTKGLLTEGKENTHEK